MALQGMKTVTEKKLNHLDSSQYQCNKIESSQAKRQRSNTCVFGNPTADETNSPGILALEAPQARKTLPSG